MKLLSNKAKIVFLSTYPPTQCGIATFTEDTVNAIHKSYGKSLKCEICEITFDDKIPSKSAYHIPSRNKQAYSEVAAQINKDAAVKVVHIQHEFGLFGGEYGDYLMDFLKVIAKPIAYTFHTVLPNPNDKLKSIVQLVCSYSKTIFVMTKKSQKILVDDYGIDENHIEFVPHGTHLVNYETTEKSKQKLNLQNRLILSTFGLLGEGKSIETGLKALPRIVEQFPNVLYLILGKTHPNTITNNIDTYRNSLEKIVSDLHLENNVCFVNEYLEVNQLLDYLKATDVYLFTSKDPNQAVSGTFSYAMSCSCPIVASKIPHTVESLTSDIGIIAEIQNEDQFATATLKLLSDPDLRAEMALNAYTKTTQTSWENTAIKHINAYQKVNVELSDSKITYPEININHLKTMTTSTGVVRYSKISEPDFHSGYTLDDNTIALIAMCKHYELINEPTDIAYIQTYLNFIERCQNPDGKFFNFVDCNNIAEARNSDENLEDCTGRAIWALGQVLSLQNSLLPKSIQIQANKCIDKWINSGSNLNSPRAIGFCIKGLYHFYISKPSVKVIQLIDDLSQKLKLQYSMHSDTNSKWFEKRLTYANSVLPEALLLSSKLTGKENVRFLALQAMDFLISKMFVNGEFRMSNIGENSNVEKPLESYMIMETLDLFYSSFGDANYKKHLKLAFDWFLGKNHLSHVMYDPLTGGCYDALEECHINLNQSSQSTAYYLLARILVENYRKAKSMYVVDNNRIISKEPAYIVMKDFVSKKNSNENIESESNYQIKAKSYL